ncbi:RNA polymerase factor sigma-54 [Ureibacillus aquaedulcis]|uniref:RNA polymerase factor sigma-54 n=1 Tax=Ureibacillus aquaedulcis TaxID=3058421 RepID=A0ABT8GNS5_9BACL|nr:RNA polymerase factor sigma-54 [Ureibacillus sp. BA0131]MDN4493068.1 RNA polymerase factor sigma-54 [Ureibacillus sp. BA0131]
MNMQLGMQAVMSQQLTAQMIQHLSILQLTNLELKELVEQKALENPLIDLIDQQEETWPTAKMQKGSIEADYGLIAVQQTVADFLMEQIPLNATDFERAVLTYLIYSLDERLYLTTNAAEVAQHFKMELEEAERLIHILQSFEPIGVGCQNSTEFFLKHIEQCENVPYYTKVFLTDEMENIAKMDIVSLRRRYNISTHEVMATIAFIKELPRMPVISLEEVVATVIPDVSVYCMAGQWAIEVEQKAVPGIRLHDVYVELLRADAPSYLKSCMRDFTTLVQGLDFRKNTLYAITHYLIEQQPAFFEKGPCALKPMRLKDVAEALQMHESTISRAIKGKYLHTAQGNFAMNDLFVKAINNVTTSSVCDRIATIIAEENKRSPYSDQQLALLLKEQGIVISRRTVAKYREQLNIPSSQKRAYLLLSKIE